MMKLKIRKGDTVIVRTGRDRGKTGRVMRVVPEERRVFVERLNVVKRHQKARSAQQPGGIVEKEAPLHVSKVMLVCSKCNKPTRVGRARLEDGRPTRVCKRCEEQLDA
jgi:large subunit ribosomal protein L24